jgi:hypothetical protein
MRTRKRSEAPASESQKENGGLMVLVSSRHLRLDPLPLKPHALLSRTGPFAFER